MAKKKSVWVSLRVDRSITETWPAAYDMFHALETSAVQVQFDFVPLVGDTFLRHQLLEMENVRNLLSDVQRRALEGVDRFMVLERSWVRIGKNEYLSLFLKLNGIQPPLPELG